MVTQIRPVVFDDDAWDHLVLDQDTKVSFHVFKPKIPHAQFNFRLWLEPLSRSPKILLLRPRSFPMSFPGKVGDWWVIYIHQFAHIAYPFPLGFCTARSSRYRKDPYRRSGRGKSPPSSVHGWFLRATHHSVGVGIKIERHTTSKIRFFYANWYEIEIICPTTKACYGMGRCPSHRRSWCMVISHWPTEGEY